MKRLDESLSLEFVRKMLGQRPERVPDPKLVWVLPSGHLVPREKVEDERKQATS